MGTFTDSSYFPFHLHVLHVRRVLATFTCTRARGTFSFISHQILLTCLSLPSQPQP